MLTAAFSKWTGKTWRACFLWACPLWACLPSGCAAGGREEAFRIQEEFYARESEVAKEMQESPSNPRESMKFDVDMSKIKMVGAKDEVSYNGFTLQVTGVERGETIYDVKSLMSEEEAKAYCEGVASGAFLNGMELQPDGTFKDGMKDDGYLYFIRCRIKNNNDAVVNFYMTTIFYGITGKGHVGWIPTVTYAYSGRHEQHHDPATGVTTNAEYVFLPGEELETVFMINFIDAPKYDRAIDESQLADVNVYLSSEMLKGAAHGGGSNLWPGTHLIPIFTDGNKAQ